MSHTTLNTLLDAAADLGPEYGGYLSSHLPMALLALHALGADDQRLRQFFDAHRPHLPPVPAATVDDGRGEQALFGHIEHFSLLRQRFAAELAAAGRDAMLRRLLPLLVPGCAGAAFHGLIRTAYAVQAGHAVELAAALAYWAARWHPLPAPQATPMGTADAWLQRLQQAPPGPSLPDRSIAGRAARLAGTPVFAPWAGPVPAAPDWPARLARAAVQRYLSSRDFSVLHLVTAGHALRVLQPWLDEAAWPHFVRAFSAVWLSARTDPAAAPQADPGDHWPAIVAQALRSDDEHVVKLVHSCREEEALHGGPAWRHAAALVVRHGA
jgi:hypothetical protein